MPWTVKNAAKPTSTPAALIPFWATTDKETVNLYLGDVLKVLQQMPSGSVQCVVTSPPYWGLRDYGTGSWKGGDSECKHKPKRRETCINCGISTNEKNDDCKWCKDRWLKRSINNTPNVVHPTKGRDMQNLPEPPASWTTRHATTTARTSCATCGAVRVEDHQLGSEDRPDCKQLEEVSPGLYKRANCAEKDWATGCHVCRMVLVFREVRRVLRDDGVMWMNYGDSYASSPPGHKTVDGMQGSDGMYKRKWNSMTGEDHSKRNQFKQKPPLPSGNLVGIPWRVALALQADGWVLRQDIIWCLSGGTWVYVRSQKGEMPMMLSDAARLDPKTVQLWNGERWTQVLGWTKSLRQDDEIELVLRSGERISCTPSHQFPTGRGLLRADEIQQGDRLTSAKIPQPSTPHEPLAVTLDAAWFIGLYLAEGSRSDHHISIAGHAKEWERWERVKKVVEYYGGSATLSIDGNKQAIRVHGRMLHALLDNYLSGKTAKDKALKVRCWQHTDEWLLELLLGYLSGDGSWDEKNGRWRLGFCRNYSWERDLRTLAARIGFRLILTPGFSDCKGKKFPTFRGEIRFVESEHHNRKDPLEVVEIRKSRCREVYDVGVADEPHLFALASGVLTHNSKPSPMPESVRNRCTKAHEYVFLLAKKGGYFCDMEAIKEGGQGRSYGNKAQGKSGLPTDGFEIRNFAGVSDKEYHTANKRSVWSVSSQGYPGSHFATFPPNLITPMIKAGTSEHGCCGKCQAPWKRVTEEKALVRDRPNEYVKRVSKLTGGGKVRTPGDDRNHSNKRDEGSINIYSNTVAGVEVKTLGWEPTCTCFGKFEKRKRKIVKSRVVNVPGKGTVDGGGPEETAGYSKFSTLMRTQRTTVEREDEEVEESYTVYLPSIPLEDHPVVPCTVLDPFIGSGTSCAVAVSLGRRGIGIDLSEEYLRKHAVVRVLEACLAVEGGGGMVMPGAPPSSGPMVWGGERKG